MDETGTTIKVSPEQAKLLLDLYGLSLTGSSEGSADDGEVPLLSADEASSFDAMLRSVLTSLSVDMLAPGVPTIVQSNVAALRTELVQLNFIDRIQLAALDGNTSPYVSMFYSEHNMREEQRDQEVLEQF